MIRLLRCLRAAAALRRALAALLLLLLPLMRGTCAALVATSPQKQSKASFLLVEMARSGYAFHTTVCLFVEPARSASRVCAYDDAVLRLLSAGRVWTVR